MPKADAGGGGGFFFFRLCRGCCSWASSTKGAEPLEEAPPLGGGSAPSAPSLFPCPDLGSSSRSSPGEVLEAEAEAEVDAASWGEAEAATRDSPQARLRG